ncbi:acetyltransferase [Actinobacillus equuli]|nr:acetyltransferase [Actinobacillus equuli]
MAGRTPPQGNLVAQYLCFQGNLLEACQLRSVRISRIAVQPELQQQGIGKRLISDFILQKFSKIYRLWIMFGQFRTHRTSITLLATMRFSISANYPTKEASSGYHSAMMLYPISEQGQRLCNKLLINLSGI